MQLTSYKGKALRRDSIRRIRRIIISAGAWIDGIEITYETTGGCTISQMHGSAGGADTFIDFAREPVRRSVFTSLSRFIS